MLEPLKGVSFNVVKTSDGRITLEWQAVDALNRQAQQFRTVHDSFDSLSEQLKQTLTRASVV